MIRYALACDNGHDFESWFPSGSSFDAQVARGLVQCPNCSSTRIEKRIMAPAIGKSSGGPPKEAAAFPQPPSPVELPQPVAILSEREQATRAMLRAVREHVTKTADYVGTGFAEEARRMHYGESEHRSVYGEASTEEARALLDEGIEIHPLPIDPDDRN